MGSIKRQGIGSGIFMYLGLIVGFVNNLLFPRFIGAEVLGFTIWVMEITGFLILLSGFGGNISIIRFFPYFKDKEKGHNGYLGFLFTIRTLGLIITSILILLLKDVVIEIYDRPGSREYIEAYYPLLIVSLALLTYTDMLENYLAALMRPRIPTFFRDVFIRLVALALIFLYFFGIISLEVFIIAYIARFIAGILGMLLFTQVIGELHFTMDWGVFRKPIFKKIANYSFFSIFASLGSKFTTKIDILMIPSMVSMGATGIYGLFSYFASVITLPHNGIAKITSPILADAWKREDFTKIKELYSRTALNNFAAGMLIYVGIIINLDNIVHMVGPEFEAGKYVAVFLGLGQLAHAANGYNGIILNYSPKYRYDLAFKAGTAVLNIVANYVLINLYGITGAAIATALTIITINSLSQAFVYRHYRIHPFSRNMLGILLLGGVCILANAFLPVIETHFIVDLLVRSSAVTILYLGLLLGLKVTPDINEFVGDLWKRFIKKL